MDQPVVVVAVPVDGLGLAMSAGGLFMPLLGIIATYHGPRGALAVLATVPVLAMLLSAFLREPVQDESDTAEDAPLTVP